MLRALALATTLLVLVPVRGFPILGRLFVLGELWPGEDSPWLTGNGVMESRKLPSLSLFLPLIVGRITVYVLGRPRLASAAAAKVGRGGGFLCFKTLPKFNVHNQSHTLKIILKCLLQPLKLLWNRNGIVLV